LKRLLFLSLFGLLQFPAICQTQPDSLSHSPRKATIYSAIIPGAGQIYNRKYWKLPIVYGGLGACIYFIDRNTKKFNIYKQGLIADKDGDPATINTTGYSAFQLDELQDTYRNWKDLSWIVCAGVYVLQILDANVDAHLRYFDVSKDLSLFILPSIDYAGRLNSGFSLSLNF
jgi:hypothetical protein